MSTQLHKIQDPGNLIYPCTLYIKYHNILTITAAPLNMIETELSEMFYTCNFVVVLANVVMTASGQNLINLLSPIVRFGQPKIVRTEIVVIADIFNQ